MPRIQEKKEVKAKIEPKHYTFQELKDFESLLEKHREVKRLSYGSKSIVEPINMREACLEYGGYSKQVVDNVPIYSVIPYKYEEFNDKYRAWSLRHQTKDFINTKADVDYERWNEQQGIADEEL